MDFFPLDLCTSHAGRARPVDGMAAVRVTLPLRLEESIYTTPGTAFAALAHLPFLIIADFGCKHGHLIVGGVGKLFFHNIRP